MIFWYSIIYRGNILSVNDFVVTRKLASVTVILIVCFHSSIHSVLTGKTNKSPVVAFCITLSSRLTDISLFCVDTVVWNLRLKLLHP